MSRRVLVALLGMLTLAVPVFAQLPVGRVVPTDNFTIGHIGSTVHVAGNVTVRQHVSGGLTMGAVSQCGTTARTVIATNVNRRSLILQNTGGRLMYIGGTHATITAANGFPLHAGATSDNPQDWHAVLSRVELPFYRGPIACLTVGAGSELRFIEILDPGGPAGPGF